MIKLLDIENNVVKPTEHCQMITWLKVIQDKNYNHLHFNPGAAGVYGFHKKRTMLKFTLDNGKIKNLNVIELNNNQKLSKPIN